MKTKKKSVKTSMGVLLTPVSVNPKHVSRPRIIVSDVWPDLISRPCQAAQISSSPSYCWLANVAVSQIPDAVTHTTIAIAIRTIRSHVHRNCPSKTQSISNDRMWMRTLAQTNPQLKLHILAKSINDCRVTQNITSQALCNNPTGRIELEN